MFKENPADDDSSSSSSDDGSQDSSAEIPKPVEQKEEEGNTGRSTPEVDESGSASPEKSNGLKGAKAKLQWNDLFEYQSSVLAKMLLPTASGHKKRFEVGLNDKVFLGRPVFARPDGFWRKPKKSRRSSSKSNVTAEKVRRVREQDKGAKVEMFDYANKDSGTSGPDTGMESQSDSHRDKKTLNEEDEIENGEPVEQTHDMKSNRSSKSDMLLPKKEKQKPLAIFHVVFVLRPPPLEYHLRVKEMYDNVTKKLSKAMKWEQTRSDYVAREAAMITSLTKHMDKLNSEKQNLATLYHDIISRSSLAKAISTLFNSITASRIAHIGLSPTLSLSLQIPFPTSISILPNALAPQLPGLWLTTANSMPTDDDVHGNGPQLGAHFTLLLLSDLHSILADINATASPITRPLTHYLRVTTSTKSFLQISQSSGIPLTDIQFLASHLIYWRRAQAIPPLHQRDVYMVSPNADMRNLATASQNFTKTFPALPPLAKILNMLSFTSRPYSTLIPSKDHKPTYMDILAWLMRGGWVTQLRTFAWVRVPAHIKEAVTKEAATNAASRQKKSSETEPTDGTDTSGTSSTNLNVPPSHSSSNSPSPTSSTHTTLPVPQPATPYSASLIPNPRLASALPSRYLSAVSTHILNTQGPDAQSAWEKCVVYFDGHHAIETIPVREGWKRKRVTELMGGWEGAGVLVRGRHW
ncbi:MAG: Nitrogen permease regulator 3 [Alectoria sarmentosa]|nr:MAG: Nitrogen permease regulator 3 [Alectoria sarmentosa]